MAYVNELSGSKLRSKLGSSFNEAAAAPVAGFAKKQLEKMGWKSGQGLGKDRQGINTHIKVKKREDDVGIGHVKPELQVQEQWWNDSMGDVFSRLNGGKKKVTKKKFTDDELFEATGGARFGMRARRKQTAKWARAETHTKEDEDEAKSKLEWNGQGQAKVVLKEKKRKNGDEGTKKKTHKDDDDEEEEPRKKKRKKNKEKSEKKDKKKSKKEKVRGELC